MRYSSVISAVALATLASAQTFTDCDPTKKTCPADTALGKTVTIDFTKGKSDQFDLAEGTTLTYGTDGAEFTINKEGQAPTITSNWYIFFGKVEVVLKASPGKGIVSSFVMESDDLDEIDWEWLGGDLTEVETNYFGKGNTTTYDRATYVPVSAPQDTFHTYTIEWKSSAITWAIDGTVIRTLAYADANGGANFPQTPMQVKLGNWVGGSSTAPKGTVEWAGGLTDFKEAPFVMYVKSLTVQDYSTGGASYVYSDKSGSWQSIKTSDEEGSTGGDDSSSSSSSASATASADSTKSSVKASTTVSSITKNASSATESTETSEATPSSSGATNLGAGAVVSTTLSSTTSPTGSSTSGASASGASATTTPNAASHNGGVAQYAIAGLGFLGYLAM
jgi:beta-glucanase (GH16 family)